jgi:hypothetical protein
VNIVLINSANFVLSFNGKQINFTDGTCGTDEEENKDGL